MRKTIEIPAKLYREFPIELGERQEGDEDGGGRYPISFSSEVPIRRWSWEIGEYFEILSHLKDDVDLDRAKRGLPALKSHFRVLHFGSVTEIRIDEGARRSSGLLGFSSIDLGVEQKTLVDEGHLRTVSVGYEIREMILEKIDENQIPTYRCKWSPFEVSTEPVPADYDVGFGRAAERGEKRGELRSVEIDVVETAAGGERIMDPKDKKVETRTAPAADPAPAPEIRGEDKREIRDLAKENAEISEMCAENGVADRAAGFIREGLTPDQVSRKILEHVRTVGSPAPGAEALDGMAERDKSRYSIRRALAIAAKFEKRDGLEAEIDTELKLHRTGADHGGILVPWRLRGNDELSPRSRRTLGTGEAASGVPLVDEIRMPDMIDLLRNRSLTLSFGARLYAGLTGVVQFTRKTSAPTVYWMEENPAADVPDSEPAYGYVLLSPKTLMGSVPIPRQLLTMASIDVEADIRTDLAVGHALALDLAALHGTGTDKQPEGIYSAAGVLVKAMGGKPDLAKVSNMTGKVADANADIGALAFMTTPLMAELLSVTEKASGYPVYLWTGTLQDGVMLGYPAGATNQISKTLVGGAEHGLIFGNWSDLMLGLWGNDLELVVDPYTLKKKGQVEITSYSMGDTALRRGASFCKATGATIV